MQFMPFIQNPGATKPGETAAKVSSAAKAGADKFAALLDDVTAKPGVRPVLFKGGQGEEPTFGIWDGARTSVKGFSAKAAAGRFTGILDGKTGKGIAKQAGTDAASALLAAKLGKGVHGKAGLKDVINLKMTLEDFAALKSGLRKAGLSKAELDDLAAKIGSEGGLTWGAFVNVLSGRIGSLGKTGSVVLSETQERDLLTFFGKLGFQPGAAKNLLGELKAGNTDKVMNTVVAKMATLPADTTIDIRSNELAALSTALKLSPEGASRLATLLNGAEQASVSLSQLTTILTAVKGEVSADLQSAVTSGQELFDLVEKVLGQATERQATIAQADARTNGDTRTNQILAEGERRERARQEAAKNGDGQAAEAGGSKDAKGHAARVLDQTPPTDAARVATQIAAGVDGKGKDAKARTKGAEGDSSAQDAKAAKTEHDARLERTGQGPDGKNAKGGTGKDAMAEGKSDTAKAWDALMSKVRVDASADARADIAAAQQAQQATDAARNTMDETLARLDRDVSARMMRQVQSGILKNMGNGTKQLTLELEPAELGRLHMVMQAKDGEVSITLRAETQDAGRVLSEQLSHLRTQLEQQGIKVAKMEVQTQLQNQNQGNGWYGENQHNMAQEQKNFLDRRGIWRMLRQEGMDMAQEMQIDPQTAGIARDGLYIVA